MRFEIVHEFEIPLDALELAVLSPQLWEKLAVRLKNIEEIRQTTHELSDGVLDRVSGSYELKSGSGGMTKRVVTGNLELKVPRGLRELGERMIVSEVKKTFEAEAATLRDLATLS